MAVLPIDGSTYYHGELLNGDEVDPHTLIYTIPEERISPESSENGN